MDIEFEFSRDYPTRTVKQLIQLFYKWNTYKEGTKILAAHPLGFVSNPHPWVITGDPFAEDVWVVVYSGIPNIQGARYFITIEINSRDINGPHATKLFIQVYPGKTGHHPARMEWLASAQIMGSFYNEDKMRSKVRRLIRLKKFFASEHSLAQVIEFDEWQHEAYGA